MQLQKFAQAYTSFVVEYVVFRHQELGQVDLTIQKAGGDQLNIMVGANSTEAMKFFTQNRGELLQSLTQAGVSVGDFKLDSSSKSNNQNLSQE